MINENNVWLLFCFGDEAHTLFVTLGDWSEGETNDDDSDHLEAMLPQRVSLFHIFQLLNSSSGPTFGEEPIRLFKIVRTARGAPAQAILFSQTTLLSKAKSQSLNGFGL